MQTFKGLCVAALAGAALAACSPAAPAADTTEKPAEPAAPAAAASGPVAFSVNVTLSKMAIDRMVKDGDKVRVSATYYGTPKPGVTPAPDPSRAALGADEKTVAPASQVVKFTGAYDAEAAKSIEGEPRVLINAISTDIDRGKYPMDCTTFDGSLKEAAGRGDAGVEITCKAFGEP